MKISAIVVTYNEEKNITDCLQTINWVDEIIIVDSNSTDQTISKAKNFTSKIYNIDSQSITNKRKFGITKASNDWVFFLDSDERVPEKLKQEIVLLEENKDVYGYYLNRKNYYLGCWIQHSGINPDYVLRLYKKTKGYVTDRLIHEAIEVDGICKKLKNSIEHYTVTNLEQLFAKSNFFSTMEAKENFLKNKKITKLGVFAHALSAFFRIFISRKGYKDKLPGFYVSFSYSFVNFLGHLKLLKLQNKI
jgi:glycosyltransferase involved in cell wall biosynthesis